MKLDTLKKGVGLHNRIEQLKEAMQCFVWPDGTSKNPTLIIEHIDFDGDGKVQTRMPFYLGEELIGTIKAEIQKELDKAESEFKAL